MMRTDVDLRELDVSILTELAEEREQEGEVGRRRQRAVCARLLSNWGEALEAISGPGIADWIGTATTGGADIRSARKRRSRAHTEPRVGSR